MSSLEQLEHIIETKITEGIFHSQEDAVETICRWLEKIDHNFIYETMHEEDA